MAEKIPEEVKKAVTFIFFKDDLGNLVPNGTGFFVSIQSKEDSNLWYVYLVTAKHVLLNDETQRRFDSIYLRLNKHTGGLEIFEIPLKGPDAFHVFEHQDSTVDIALINITLDPKIFDCRFIATDMITTKKRFKELEIGEGDAVFFVGLFVHYFGQQRNYPIVRFGRVALITDEKIPWKDSKDNDRKMLDLYLIESQSFGGNSGSPVFFYPGATRYPGRVDETPAKLFLAGIMKGSFLDAKEIDVVETRRIPISYNNVGIAAVVPAYKLREILRKLRPGEID